MNQPPDTRYVIVLKLPRSAEIAIEDTFLDLAGLSRPAMGYHITLLGPFLLAQDQCDAVVNDLGALADRATPTPITVRGMGAFSRDASHTPYLDIQVTAELMALKDALWDAVGVKVNFSDDNVRTFNLPANFHPHITLGLAITDAELDAFRRPQAEPFLLSFAAEQLVLLTQYRDGPWEIQASLLLGATGDGKAPSSDY